MYSKEFDTVEDACEFAKEYFRPKLQLCNEKHVRLSKVDEFERIIQTTLPKDYRDFLLDFNGDYLILKNVSLTVSDVNEQIGIDTLFGFSDKRSLNLISWYREYESELPENTIIIGASCGCGLLVLIWQEDWQGVFLWDSALALETSTEEDCLYRISDSFKEFRKLIF